VARSRNSGVLGAWAEQQRRQQRLYEAQQRAWRAEQLQQERAQRAAIRAHTRDHRKALHAYQHGREMDAAARTGELDAQVTRLAGIFQSVLAAPPFQLEKLIQEISIPPFAPGPLAVPACCPARAPIKSSRLLGYGRRRSSSTTIKRLCKPRNDVNGSSRITTASIKPGPRANADVSLITMARSG